MTVTNSNELKNYIKNKKTAVALGSFDALHKGHTKVICRCIEYATEKGLLSVVQLVEIPNFKRVNTLEKRLEILEDMGADIVVIEEFSSEFKKVRYDEFVENGDMERATRYMGRPFSLSGKVVHGRAIGRTLGFPTANIEIPDGFVIPKSGVYATKVLIGGKRYFSVTNVGAKPTVNDEKPNIESYIFEFDGELYGDKIQIEFCKRLRNIKKFENTEQLSGQIEMDKQTTQKYFGI